MKSAHWRTAIIASGIVIVAVLAAQWQASKPDKPSAAETPEPVLPRSQPQARVIAPSPGPDWRTEPIDELPARLGDAATRAIALRDLSIIPYQRIEDLFKAARHVTDARVRDDLLARAYALQQQVAANPPPISIAVTDVSLEELAAALCRETGTQVSTLNIGTAPAMFTVNKTDQPFWAVLCSAADQHPFSINPNFNRNRLELHEERIGMPARVINGPFCVYMNVRDNQAVSTLVPAPATKPQLQWIFRYIVGVDPRIWVLDSSLKLTLGPDDAGNTLLPADYVVPINPARPSIIKAAYGDASFTPPARPGKMLPKVKLEGTIRIATSEYEGVFSTDQPADQSVTLGDTTVYATFYSSGTPQQPHYSVRLQADNGKDQNPVVSYAINDGPERLLDTESAGRSGFRGFSYPGPPSPFEVHFRVPRTIEERHVSFEVDNVPLPALPQ